MREHHQVPENSLSRPDLRPLPNPLGRNGPYIEGTGTAVERDCARIDGHSDLFRNLERFEMDLREAIDRLWDRITEIKIIEQRTADGLATPEDMQDAAVDGLKMALGYMQEAYLIAEVLDDREKRRIADHERKQFVDFIATTPRDEMSAMERLAEEANLTWQISRLLDRMNEIRGAERREWPKIDREDLERFIARLDRLTKPHTSESLQAMSDDELAAELKELEERSRATRRAITVIHAIRTVRHG